MSSADAILKIKRIAPDQTGRISECFERMRADLLEIDPGGDQFEEQAEALLSRHSQMFHELGPARIGV